MRSLPAAGLGGDFCGSCICSLVDAYMPAFKAANLSTSDPGLVNSAASIITDCTTAYYSRWAVRGARWLGA